MFVELAGTATSSRKRSTATMTISCARGNHAISDRRRFASRQPSPPPRKVASRMKLEKYARSRTYAGIQRMSAISRKRTRNEAKNSVNAERPSRVLHAKLGERRVGAAGPLVDEHVPLVLKILDPHLGGPETARREIAETAEEGDAVTQAGV